MPPINIKVEHKFCPQWLRCVLLGLASIHMLGVVAEPLRFFSRSDFGVAPEFAWLGDIAKPYTQWLYLDHGYFFFAPNPGPGHLIECALTRSNESHIRLLPNRKDHWPRLHYHRYLMLSEFYANHYAPKQVTDELKKDPEFMARWNVENDLYLQIQSSMNKSLKHSTGATQVELRRIERLLPDPPEVLREGLALTDPRFFKVLPESMIEPLPSKTPQQTEAEPVPIPNRSRSGAKP